MDSQLDLSGFTLQILYDPSDDAFGLLDDKRLYFVHYPPERDESREVERARSGGVRIELDDEVDSASVLLTVPLGFVERVDPPEPVCVDVFDDFPVDSVGWICIRHLGVGGVREFPPGELERVSRSFLPFASRLNLLEVLGVVRVPGKIFEKLVDLFGRQIDDGAYLYCIHVRFYGGYNVSVVRAGSRPLSPLYQWDSISIEYRRNYYAPGKRSNSVMAEPNGCVLVVDDDPRVARVYAEQLRNAHTVRVAYSGTEALDSLDEDVDVVLLDRRMPGLTGDQVLERIRDQGLNCQVAMVTAVEPDFEIIDMDFDEYLFKPVTGEELLETVEHLFYRSALDSSLQEFFSIASKRAALEAEKSETELEHSEEFATLTTRFETLKDEMSDSLAELEDAEAFDLALSEWD